MNYLVQIKTYGSDKIVETMGPFTKRKAEQVDKGVNINLNHEQYYTVIIEKD